MAESDICIVINGGIDAYMAAADETTAKLLADGPIVPVLREYDIYFRERLFRKHQLPAIPLVLCLNAYQLFLAGLRVAVSGHSAAVFPLLRTALESAAYAGLMMQKPELVKTWTQRHQGEAENNACRRKFTFKKAIDPLEHCGPDIHRLAVQTYEAAIDFGAHPNIIGVFGHVTIDDERDDNFAAVNHVGLYGATHIETIRGLCACLDFGLAIIGIIALSFLDISDELQADLNHLNEVKNKATEPYQPTDEAIV